MFQLSIRSIVRWCVALACITFLLPIGVSAVAIGASPSRITNHILVPGISYTGEISISRDVTDINTTYYVVVSGDATDWIELHGLEKSESDNQWTIPVGEASRSLAYTITVPEDAHAQTATGFITVQQLGETTAATDEDTQSVSAASIVPAVSISIDLSVTEESIEDYIVQHITSAPVAIDDDIYILYAVDNTGNTPIHPRSINMAIISTGDNRQLLTDTIQLYDQALIEPFSSAVFAVAIPHELEVGNYWLDVAVRAPSGSGVQQFDERLSIEVVSELPQVDRGTITALSFEETEYGYTKNEDISSTITNTSDDYVPVSVRTTVKEKHTNTERETDIQVFAAAPNDSVDLTNELSFSDVGQYAIVVEARYPGGTVESGEYTVLVEDNTVVSQIFHDQKNRRIAAAVLIVLVGIVIGVIIQMTRGYVKKVDTPKKKIREKKVVATVTKKNTEKTAKSLDKKIQTKEQD